MLYEVITEKEWKVTFTCKKGDVLSSSEVFATIQETDLVLHKLMVPHGIHGEVVQIQKDGTYRLRDRITSYNVCYTKLLRAS